MPRYSVMLTFMAPISSLALGQQDVVAGRDLERPTGVDLPREIRFLDDGRAGAAGTGAQVLDLEHGNIETLEVLAEDVASAVRLGVETGHVVRGLDRRSTD